MLLSDVERVNVLSESGRHEEALREVEGLLQSAEPSDRATWLMCEYRIYRDLGRSEQARQVLDRISQLGISDPVERLHLGFHQACQAIENGRHEQGLADFAELLERYAETLKVPFFRYLYEDIQCWRAVALVNLSRWTEALPIMTESASFEFEDVGVRLNFDYCKALLLMQEGRHKKGASAFTELLHRYASVLKQPRYRRFYEDIQRRLAMALITLSRRDEALPILREFASFEFEDKAHEQRIHFELGLCCDEANDTTLAIQAFLHVLGLRLGNDVEEKARYRLARRLSEAGAYAQARKQLELIVEGYSDRNSAVPRKYVYTQLAHVCGRLGDVEGSELNMDLARKA